MARIQYTFSLHVISSGQSLAESGQKKKLLKTLKINEKTPICFIIPKLKWQKGVPLFPSVLFSFCFDFLKNKTEGFPGITFSFAIKGKSLFPSVFSKTEAFQNIQFPSKLKVKKHTIKVKASLVYILNFGLY
jgi:hypothetical protein